MAEPKNGLQLANNVTELTAVAPLVSGGAERLRAIFAKRKADEAKGERSPIEQIETIHYARWVILDGGARLLFTSNFDGDLDGYLTEFAERDEGPLNLIFGFCEGWPGARPADSFIRYVRKYMVPAEYYYGAYPKHTVKEIKRALYWKETTDEFVRTLLPELADLVVAIRTCCRENDATKHCLEVRGIDLQTLDTAGETIREFLTQLAIPTPEDFGRTKKPQEVPS
ncbi:MAG: hypothetical protein H8K10_03465 [Nitrospira sp.]|nr:hypothetical protein [Nitrospira sp.]